MQLVRDHIERRTLFAILFISLLCITFTLYAVGPAVPIITAKLLWEIVGGVSIAISLYYVIQDIIKNLDKQIESLEKEVRKLYNQRRLAWDTFWDWNSKLIIAETALETAEDALTAATQAVTDAESAVTKAVHKHQITKEDTRLKYNEYAHHVRYCDWCNGSALCSEGSRLHSEWQQWESKTAEAYKAISTAEEAVKTKEEAVKDAKSVVSYTTRMKSFWKSLKDKSKAKLDTAQNKLDTKVSELSSKEFERDLQDALLENTKGNIAEAKKQLEAVKAKYPDEWEKEMAANPDLAAKIEDILNTEEESNEDPNNLP